MAKVPDKPKGLVLLPRLGSRLVPRLGHQKRLRDPPVVLSLHPGPRTQATGDLFLDEGFLLLRQIRQAVALMEGRRRLGQPVHFHSLAEPPHHISTRAPQAPAPHLSPHPVTQQIGVVDRSALPPHVRPPASARCTPAGCGALPRPVSHRRRPRPRPPPAYPARASVPWACRGS